MLLRSRGPWLRDLGAVVVAATLVGCSSSDSNASSGDAGEDATATCNPYPLSLSVTTNDDCVAVEPNPCCGGFIGFSCAPQGDAGGPTCSETDTCVRAARYDQNLCNGGSAYSCPILNGTISAALLSPPCVQMESIGPTSSTGQGEGIRWCCGGNVTAPNLDSGTPLTGEDSGSPGVDGAAPVKDASLD